MLMQNNLHRICEKKKLRALSKSSCEKRLLSLSYVCPCRRKHLPQDGFSWQFLFGIFSKIFYTFKFWL